MKSILNFSLVLLTVFNFSHAVDYQMRVDINSNVISKTLSDLVHFNLCQAGGTCSQTYTLTSNMLHNKMYYYNFTSPWMASSIARINFWMELTVTLVCFDRVWVSGLGTVEIGVLDGCMDQDTFTNSSCTLVELDFAAMPPSYKPMYHVDPCNYTTNASTHLTSWKNAVLQTPTPAPFPIRSHFNSTQAVIVGMTVDSNVKATNGMSPVYFQICTMNDTYCTQTYKITDQLVRARSYEYQVIPSNQSAFTTLADVWTVNLWITAANTQVCVDKVWATVGGQTKNQLVAITGCMGSTVTLSHRSTAVPPGGCSFLTVDISDTQVYAGHHVFTKWYTSSETTRCPATAGAIPVTVNITMPPTTTPTNLPSTTPTTSAPTTTPITTSTPNGAVMVSGLFSFCLVGVLALW